MSVFSRCRILVASTIALAPSALSAQAFGVNEIGSCATARGFAVTASPCRDATTIYWNSAAATWLNGWSIAGGVTSVAIKGNFTQDTTGKRWNADDPVKYVPNAFINYHKAGSPLAWGFGYYYPYGLTSKWTDDFPGRFSALEATLKTFYLQPSVAWQLTPKWSIGGGPVMGHSTVELIQSVDLSLIPTGVGPTFGQVGIPTGTEFARASLTGSATAYGAQFSIAGQPSPNWSVGARFLSPLEFNYDNGNATFQQIPTNLIVGGDLLDPKTGAKLIAAGTPVDAVLAPQFAPGGPLTPQKASTKITHPAQAQGGVAYSGYKNWLLEADYFWVGWKRFNSLPVDFANPGLSKTLIEDYNNTSAVRLGAEYTLPGSGVQLRGGFTGVASAAPPETVTPLLPEQDRTYWMVGFGTPSTKMLAADLTYAHVWAPGARGRIVERTSEAQTAAQLNTGVYMLSANIFSLTIKATF